MVLRRCVRWLLTGFVLTACGGSSADEHTKAQDASGTSGQGASGKGAAGSSGATGGNGGKAADTSGVGGTGGVSRGGSGDVAGDGGNDDAPGSGGMAAGGKGGSSVIGAGGSGNVGGTLGIAGAGSGDESNGGDGTGSPLDACLGELYGFPGPPTCATATAPLDEEVAPCEFAMPTPSGVTLDFNRTSVTYTSDLGTTFIPEVVSTNCDDPPGSGFYYGDKAEPVSIVLCPCTCAAAAAGNGELDILFGCPTIVR